MKKKRHFSKRSKYIEVLFGLILLGVLLVAFFGFKTNKIQDLQKSFIQSGSLSDQSDPTEGWNTYVDSRFGYSIKYPPKWDYFGNTTVIPNPMTDTTVYFYDATQAPEKRQTHLPYEGISIGVIGASFPLLTDLPEKMYRLKSGQDDIPNSLTSEVISINGRPAIKVRGIPSRSTEYYV